MTTVGALASLVDGRVVGNADTPVSGFAAVEQAGAGDITFAAGERYRELARQSGAAAVVADQEIEGLHSAQILVKDPNLAFAVIVDRMIRSQVGGSPGIHARAEVHSRARVDPGATLHPFVVVEAGARVGPGSVLFPGVYVGRDARIGEECLLYPQVTVMDRVRVGDRVILHPGVVLGADGFGYAMDPEGRHVKIPQTGTVVVEDDVEIGAGTCVDRARFDETRIGEGTKIDNLVQVAHNVVIGPHSVVVSQAGIAGSTELGHHVVLGGHVGVAGHVKIGDRAQVSAYSGVAGSLRAGQRYMGIPARPIGQGRRVRVLKGRLPEIYERLKALEEVVERLVRGPQGPG